MSNHKQFLQRLAVVCCASQRERLDRCIIILLFIVNCIANYYLLGHKIREGRFSSSAWRSGCIKSWDGQMSMASELRQSGTWVGADPGHGLLWSAWRSAALRCWRGSPPVAARIRELNPMLKQHPQLVKLTMAVHQTLYSQAYCHNSFTQVHVIFAF